MKNLEKPMLEAIFQMKNSKKDTKNSNKKKQRITKTINTLLLLGLRNIVYLNNYTGIDRSMLSNLFAFIATIIVDRDMSMAPMAGDSSIPIGASIPAASGSANTL